MSGYIISLFIFKDNSYYNLIINGKQKTKSKI